MKFILVFLLFFVSSNLVASPFPIGEGRGYAALVYGHSNYDQFFTDGNVMSLNVQGGITNEAFSVQFGQGISHRDSIIFSMIYSNIGAARSWNARKQKGLSDTYIGWKRNTKLARISKAYEFGVQIPSSYSEELLTAPGLGAHELHLAWHWAKAYSPNNLFSAKIMAKLKAGDVPHSAGINLTFQKQLEKSLTGQVFFSIEDSFGTVDILDSMDFWLRTNQTAFHLKDEYNQFVGIGFSKSITKDRQLFWSVAHKLTGKNTDASRMSYSLGVSFAF